VAPLRDHAGEVYDALVLGLRDYTLKNGFRDVVLGLSGGIDSSLVAAIAADALGPEHVHGVSMPSRYSSDGSRSDAEALATAIGCDYRTIAIEPAFAAFLDLLAPSFAGREPDLTEENLQSRIRGMLLMALSNKFGWLVLTTGNKSEMAVGYSTLYGDSAGGFAVIKDVYKTTVYELCRYVNDTRRAGDHPEACSTSRRRPSSARTSATTRACRPTRCSTRSSRRTWRTTARRRDHRRSATRPRCAASPAWSTWPSTSVASRRRACA
jgi:NAD+ synthetase